MAGQDAAELKAEAAALGPLLRVSNKCLHAWVLETALYEWKPALLCHI